MMICHEICGMQRIWINVLFHTVGKKGKKKKGKGKTLNLNEFLSAGDGKQGTSFAKKKAIDREDDRQNIGM